MSDLAASVGLFLLPWQRDVLDHGCSERRGGRWAAFENVVDVPRQNGKGSILEARQLAGLVLLEEPLQVHTAHEFKTAYEHFLRLKVLVEGSEDIMKKGVRFRQTNGELAIEMRTGARIRFLARSRTSGRGLSGDTVYLDEAFALTAAMMGALLPTLSARPNPQLWVTSSAPHYTSDYLHALLRRAKEAVEGKRDDSRLFVASWANPADTRIDDRDAWAAANPSLGTLISEETLENEYRTLSGTPDGVAEFLRERLGIAEGGDGEGGVVDFPSWVELHDRTSVISARMSFGLSVASDGAWSSFGVAGRRSDGLTHVETVDRRSGTDWVVERARELCLRHRAGLRVNPSAGEGVFVKVLREAGVTVVEVAPREYAQGCGAFLDLVRNGGLRHLNQETLNRSVASARRRSASDDLWVWARPSSVDISPLTACTLALSGVSGSVPVSYAPRRLR